MLRGNKWAILPLCGLLLLVPSGRLFEKPSVINPGFELLDDAEKVVKVFNSSETVSGTLAIWAAPASFP